MTQLNTARLSYVDDIVIPQNGIALREFRVRDGWTQERLAEMADISKQALSMYENEHEPASELTLHALAGALRLPIGAITHRTPLRRTRAKKDRLADTAEQVAA
ncbi:MAG: Helix-turn-helix domain [Streptosporangiaceae bacterium]|nr:Helix-turn-helix domain [Streptosporangiaceae bacterium]